MASPEKLAQMGKIDSGGSKVFLCLNSLILAPYHQVTAQIPLLLLSSHTSGLHAPLTLCSPCSFFLAGLSTENALPGSIAGMEAPSPRPSADVTGAVFLVKE